jgi:anti-sigma factor RsiW
MSCEYGEKLILYLYGEAEAGLKAGVEAHLRACASCRGELEALRLADSRLAAFSEEPRPAVLAAVMSAARNASRGVFSFGWREALLSGALASVLGGVFAFTSPAGKELAWNSGLDASLDSVEYSVYQEQTDLSASAGDWDYRYSELEDDAAAVSENA